VDSMTDAIKKHFSMQEGWVMEVTAKTKDKYGSIVLFKKEWQKNPKEWGLLNFELQGNAEHFDNLYFGISKSSPKLVLPADYENRLIKELSERFGEGKKGNWYPWYQYADKNFRYSGGAKQKLIEGEQLNKMLDYYSDVFRKIKEVAPLIDATIAAMNCSK
jgi:hypothetical protein